MSIVTDELEEAVLAALPGETPAENADYLRQLAHRLTLTADDLDPRTRPTHQPQPADRARDRQPAGRDHPLRPVLQWRGGVQLRRPDTAHRMVDRPAAPARPVTRSAAASDIDLRGLLTSTLLSYTVMI